MAEEYGSFFRVKLIEDHVNKLLEDLGESAVIPGDVYDLRACGPQKYTDYIIMATQLEAELTLILHALPKIRELSKKVVRTRQEIIEAITDKVDA